MRVLFFGTYDARVHPRIRTVRQGLAAAGVEVPERNVPLELDTATRVDMLRRPWRVVLLGARLLARWWRLWFDSRDVGRVDAVVVGYLGHFDVHLARLRFRGRPVALDHLASARDIAVDRGTTSPWLLSALGRLDRSALRAAEVPFVDTEEQRAALPPSQRSRATVVAVGAPQEWFAARPAEREARPDGPALTAVFFGLYTPLQGAPVIGRALALLAGSGVAVTMVGRGQDLPATRAAAREDTDVTWIDWLDPAALPALVARHDVCLGIFGTGEKALRVVPNKVYQGAAAGCAIVTSDTEPQRRALGGAAVFVPPGDPEVLAAALRDLAADRGALGGLRSAAAARADEAFRPEVVVAPLLERLGEPR